MIESAEGLDGNVMPRESRVMDAVKVDEEGRIRLRVLKPGDLYEPDFVSPDVITLRRVQDSASNPARTVDEVKQAIEASNVDFGATYDEIRSLTREP
jgi:hypothetical protein